MHCGCFAVWKLSSEDGAEYLADGCLLDVELNRCAGLFG